MPITPNGSQSGPIRESTGGSPRGWTFISTGLDCWRAFFLKYVFGLYPVKKADALGLGAAFHLYMEGKGAPEVQKAFPEYALEAAKLAERRRTRGPPMPKATSVEEEFTILGGMMTSKPDRIEKHDEKVVVRDFKTSMFFSEKDDEVWNVDVGILGECVAAGAKEALVDITVKRDKVSGPAVKVVKVTLTDSKLEAVERLVESFWEQLEDRVTRLAAADGPSRDHLNEKAPQNLRACVGKYGPCAYYARCWGKPPESLLYRLTEKPPRRWIDFPMGPQPTKWEVPGTKRKAIEVLQSPGWRKTV